MMQVFEGVDMANNDQCIIKVLKPVAAKKIKREIKVLRNLTGGPNVVALLDVVLDCKFHSVISHITCLLHVCVPQLPAGTTVS